MATIEGRAAELLRAKNFCHVSTLREDGTILTVPVWVDTDGEHIVVNSAEGRDWPANLRREGHGTCTITNQEDPYEYLTAVVDIAEDTHEGADETIDALAKKYLDEETYPFRKDGEQRVTFKLAPRGLTHRGG